MYSEQRADFRRVITNLFNQLPPFDMTLARNEFAQILNNELQFYISQISPGEGIALNEALWYLIHLFQKKLFSLPFFFPVRIFS